jgi:hypothetical protein
VVLFTEDGNPSFLYDLWLTVPNPNNINDFLEASSEIKESFENQMQALLNKKTQFKFVVQINKQDEGEVYLRLVDTMFWFVQS